VAPFLRVALIPVVGCGKRPATVRHPRCAAGDLGATDFEAEAALPDQPEREYRMEEYREQRSGPKNYRHPLHG